MYIVKRNEYDSDFGSGSRWSEIEYSFNLEYLEDVKNDLIAEIDKWNSAYDSIKPLVSEEEERLQEFKALKEQAELERIDVLNAKNSDENILAISTNLSEINANIVNEQNMVDQQLEQQQASIKNTLALFGY